jgi:hypothetical protein
MTWDTEWATEKASAAMRYLAERYPECAASEALYAHQDAAPTRRPSQRTGRPTWRLSEAT